MINFPKTLIPTKDEMDSARKFADEMNGKLNSYEGTYRGELSELCLGRMMGESHKIEHNDEKKTKEYFWDLKIDGQLVDIKTSTGGYFTVSDYILNNAMKNILYPCYRASTKRFTLIGVLDGQQIQKLASPSKFYNGYFVSTNDIKLNDKGN